MKDTEFIKQTGNNLKSIRQLCGVKSEDIASYLGMSVPGYSYLENGRTELTVSRLKQVSEFFKTPMGKFLGESTDVMTKLDAMMQEIKEYQSKGRKNGLK